MSKNKTENRGRPPVAINLTDDEIINGRLDDLAARANVSKTTIMRRRRQIREYAGLIAKVEKPAARVRRKPVVQPEAVTQTGQTVEDFARDLIKEFTLTSEGAFVSHGTFTRIVGMALGIGK